MKRWNVKSFVMGVLVASLVFSLASPALAVTLKPVELWYNDIKIRLNGEELIPKNANGEVVEPFIIEGTTYLPVRAIASALGLNVDWDATTQTVILGNDPEYNQPAAWLGDLEPFTGSAYKFTTTNQQYSNSATANNGDTFDRMYSSDNTNGATYLLKGQYSTLTGTWYFPKELVSIAQIDPDVSENRFLVYADEQLIYTSPVMRDGIEPIDFSVNLQNCYKMQILWQYRSGDSWINGKPATLYYGNGGRHSSSIGLGSMIGNPALWTN